MTEAQIRNIKVYAQTAIPYGKYNVTIDIVSPKMSQRRFTTQSGQNFRDC